MNIDFPPPSNGIYNNAGSSRRLANYLEHEDLERIEKGIYVEGFFNLSDENLYKSQVIKDIDSNKAQLLKTDAKFYAIHISPSTKELQAMGKTEEEQAEFMKKYIREVFIPEYAKNFNKGLSPEDIKFYGKIHFDRERSENKEGNMHCHVIVSRKDQSNKVKLSPLTNHRNTKKGVVKSGFDRKNLFQNVEKGFDKLFNHNRSLDDSFEYYNAMKNGSIEEQIQMVDKIQTYECKDADVQISVCAEAQVELSTELQIDTHVDTSENIQSDTSVNLGLDSTLGLFAPEVHGEDVEELKKMEEIKRRRRRGLRR